MKVALLCLLLAGCAPFTRVVLKRCPSLVPLGADVAVTGVGLALGVDAYNRGEAAQTAVFVTTGMLFALAANMSECR